MKESQVVSYEISMEKLVCARMVKLVIPLVKTTSGNSKLPKAVNPVKNHDRIFIPDAVPHHLPLLEGCALVSHAPSYYHALHFQPTPEFQLDKI